MADMAEDHGFKKIHRDSVRWIIKELGKRKFESKSPSRIVREVYAEARERFPIDE